MRFILLCLVAGCASSPDNQCSAGGPYEAGRSDAMFGRRTAFETYAQHCPRDAAAAADYQLGWAIGYSETSFRQPN